MWLLLRQDEIERTYGEAWQRVEAFRRLLRTTAGPINGAPPANRTGVLDIERLLLAALPAAGGLSKAPPDKDNGPVATPRRGPDRSGAWRWPVAWIGNNEMRCFFAPAIVVVSVVTFHATATVAKGIDEAMRLSALHEIDFVR